MAKTKKVDPKAVAKKEIMGYLVNALEELNFEIGQGVDYGMTSSTIVCSHSTCDVQIKLITPKTGLDRYPLAE